MEYNLFTSKGAHIIASFLKDNSTIVRLSLYGNPIDSNGCKSFAKALSHNKKLTHLSLYGCKIQNDGALSLIKSLKNNFTLTYLNIDKNQIDDRLVEHCYAYTDRNSGKSFPQKLPDISNFIAMYGEDGESSPTTNNINNSKSFISKPPSPQITTTSVPLNFQSIITSPKILASTNTMLQSISPLSDDEKNYQSYSNNETSAQQQWSQEREKLLHHLSTLVKEKEILLKHINDLNSQFCG